eukprot:COSAG05_NODE_1763_length_4127_cov_2.342354_1_plen_476_part_00
MGALAWGHVAIAQACESLHHSVTQMSVFSQKYTQIKVKPPQHQQAAVGCGVWGLAHAAAGRRPGRDGIPVGVCSVRSAVGTERWRSAGLAPREALSVRNKNTHTSHTSHHHTVIASCFMLPACWLLPAGLAAGAALLPSPPSSYRLSHAVGPVGRLGGWNNYGGELTSAGTQQLPTSRKLSRSSAEMASATLRPRPAPRCGRARTMVARGGSSARRRGRAGTASARLYTMGTCGLWVVTTLTARTRPTSGSLATELSGECESGWSRSSSARAAISSTLNTPAAYYRELVTAVAPWPERALHMVCAFDGSIWVMGGQANSPVQSAFVAGNAGTYETSTEQSELRDVWRSNDWKDWTLVTDCAPWGPRGMITGANGGVAVHHGRMWILGGGHVGPQGVSLSSLKYWLPDQPRLQERLYFNDVWSSANGSTWTRHLIHARRGMRDTIMMSQLSTGGSGCLQAATRRLKAQSKLVWTVT